jgi:O-antigen ligase
LAGIGSSVYAAIVFFIALIEVASGSNLMATQLFFGYDSYRFYNHVQTVALPLAALLALGGISARARAVGWLALILGFALLLLSTGRATSLGLIAGCAVTLLLFRRSALRYVAAMVAGAAAGALAYGSLMYALPWALKLPPPAALLDDVAGTGSYKARLFLWRLAVDYIRESPWLGIGPMHYAHRVNVEGAHPHNVYLQVAAEWGVPMLLLVLAVSLWALWRFSQRIRACGDAAEQSMGIGLFAGCVAVAVDGFFSGNFVMPVSQMWIAFLIGLSIAWCRSQAPKTIEVTTGLKPPPSWYRAGRVAIAAALVGSQLWLFYNVYPEAAHLSEHLDHVQNDLAPNPRTNPRFWSHGWF